MKRIIKKIIRRFIPGFKYAERSYSQDGEDMLLRAFYEGKENPNEGFYIDIGAHHPFRFSNTAYFYKKGWRGINIEPTPSLFKAFLKDRNRDINLNIGVSDQVAELTFYEFNDGALNSFDEKLSLSRENDIYQIVNRKKIQVKTLVEILDQHLPKGQTIDFMTIDAEGLDLRILQSNDWGKYNPNYILVEGQFKAEELINDEIYQFLSSKMYRLVGRTQRTSLFQYS